MENHMKVPDENGKFKYHIMVKETLEYLRKPSDSESAITISHLSYNQIIHPKTKPIDIKELNYNNVTFMNGFAGDRCYLKEFLAKINAVQFVN
ncbi:hypothetical protein H8356DRAFT_1341406 [Neocallimastix lanati (nom. inval.)]|nr:hypothetical protein H8356DRAFT_1341406 [Neocallimastix sp. JGI-2020a]